MANLNLRLPHRELRNISGELRNAEFYEKTLRVESVEGLSPSGKAAQAKPLQNLVSTLSPREREVFDEMLVGKAYHEVAKSLNISYTTVKFHVANILQKLGVRNRVEAILYGSGEREMEFIPLTSGQGFTEKDLRKAATKLVELGLAEKKVINGLVLDLLAALGGKI